MLAGTYFVIMEVMKKSKNATNKKKRNVLAVVIITSIVIGIALAVLGSFYLWLQGCQGKVIPGPKPSILTQCDV
jgi:multisubunit Na+/H+ antiporter MnhC subunit